MGITFVIPTFAEEAADEKNGALKVYMDELSRINEELGTDYGIPVEYFDESELEKAKQFFSEMSIDEFRDYIYTIHYNSVNNIRSVQERFEENKLVPTVAVSVEGGWQYSLILGHGAVLSALAAVCVLASCRAAESETAVIPADAENETDNIGEQYLIEEEYRTRIPLFSSTLKANGKEYGCEVFMYFVESETEDTINGMTAIELSYNGTILDRKNIYSGCGIGNPAYPKDGENEYWSVLPLKNDVAAFIAPADGDFCDAVFITVNSDEKLEWITRNFSAAEMAEKEKNGERITIPEQRFFTITGSYEISGNDITFRTVSDSFSVSFDFENYELLCGDENTQKIVYYQ